MIDRLQNFFGLVIRQNVGNLEGILRLQNQIKPIYSNLGKDSELEKCLHGKTQNTNESFNGLI